MPSFDFGRIAAQTAKQVISFNVREAERERKEAKELNYQIVLNDDLTKATKEIYEIICRARL